MNLDTVEFNRPYLFDAPSKLNLRLKIVGRKEDGYHLLSMLNVTTSLVDTISVAFSKFPLITLEVSGPEAGRGDDTLLNPAENLASRALTSFFHRFEISLGAEIKLIKNVPFGAGLGGGSGDAAAMLLFLESLMEKSEAGLATRPIIEELGLSLGADVPFFLHRGFAHVTGIGELVRTLPFGPLEGTEVAILVPRVRLATKKMFSLFKTLHPIIKVYQDQKISKAFASAEAKGSPLTLEHLLPLCENDLETTVSGHCAEVRKVLETLRAERLWHVCLTGSGSAVFALPKSAKTFEKEEHLKFKELAGALDSKCFLARLIS